MAAIDEHGDFPLEEPLLQSLRIIPHHAIGLRRNKYRVVRRISNELRWNIVKDSEATIVWLDKWLVANSFRNERRTTTAPDNSRISAGA
jgi:hypothetical protein